MRNRRPPSSDAAPSPPRGRRAQACLPLDHQVPFAKGWANCRVRTSATIWSAEGGAFGQALTVPLDAILFRVIDPAAGEGSYVPVVARKADADLALSLKKGDAVALRGSPRSAPSTPMTKKYFFAASKVEQGKLGVLSPPSRPVLRFV